MKVSKRYRLGTGKPPKLSEWNPADKSGAPSREDAEKRVIENRKAMSELQYKLYAEDKQALLIVLQGMDTAGKDGTIRNVMADLNPQGCRVASFKKPSENELQRDFLWRVHRNVPGRGEIGIFNRSHYEDVLVVRVHSLVPKSVWSQRYDQINRFEQTLAETGTRIVKIFLNISKGEQRERLQSRLDNPEKNWKFNRQDLEERKYWGDYRRAYSEVFKRCHKPWAPWYLVPADRKWYRNLVISEIVLDTLRDINPKIPKPAEDLSGIVVA